MENYYIFTPKAASLVLFINKISKMKELVSNLKNDKSFKQGFIDNMAMAYKDNEHWYLQKTKKKYLNLQDKYIIANKAAEYFIELIIK